jgi:phosphate transport system permease protein
VNGPSRRTRVIDRSFRGLCLAAVLVPIILVAVLLLGVVVAGLARLQLASVWPALLDSVVLVSLTGLFAVPIGAGAAIYLEEYGVEGTSFDTRGVWRELLEFNLANLAGVSPVLYGLLGLELFGRVLGLGLSPLAGALTLAVLILPVVIGSSREALRSVSAAQREAARALGGTRWQVVRHVVLPMALPRMLSGAILALARAIGEAAPLVVFGLLLGPALPALPVRIFSWIGGLEHEQAASAILVLLLVLLALGGLASVVRARAARQLGEVGEPRGGRS